MTYIYPWEQENGIDRESSIDSEDEQVEDGTNAGVRSEQSILETDLGALEAKCHIAC